MPLISAGDVVTVKCTLAISNGLEVRFGDWTGILPRSQISIRPPDCLESLIDQEFECEILEIKREPIVGRRSLLERQQFVKLSVGQVLRGTIVESMDFGSFVDLDGILGMLHVDDILDSYLPPTSKLPIGTTITVQILALSQDGMKVALKMIG